MKKITFLHFLFASILFLRFNTSIFAQSPPITNCTAGPPPIVETTSVNDISPCLRGTCQPQLKSPKNEPYLYEGDCTIAINRYLSRAIETNLFSGMNYNIDNSNTTTNCDMPYDAVGFDYCPQKYCNFIKGLVEINAQLIARAYGGASFHEHEIFPGERWYNIGVQTIRDINYAYDCAGLRRPVIQACVFDVTEPNNFLAEGQPPVVDGIDRRIPRWLIERFFCEENYGSLLTDPSVRDYYFNPDGTAKENLYFRRERVLNLAEPGRTNPWDMRKLEMKLWIMYQAMVAINMGYTSIHMGIYWEYASSDVNGEDPGFKDLHKITNMMRDYAKDRGSFVLISGESQDNKPSATLNNNNKTLIFDFDSRAMRPRELTNPQTEGDFQCTTPIPQYIIDAYNSSPCANGANGIRGDGGMPAVLDPCVVGVIGGLPEGSKGVSPFNPDCEFESVPYIVHWDGFSGDKINPACLPIDPVTQKPIPEGDVDPCDPNCWLTGPNVTPNADNLTWGYDDNKWFGAMMNGECKKWWFNFFYCDRRNYDAGNGYPLIPGLMRITNKQCLGCLPPDPRCGKGGQNKVLDGKFIMFDDTSFTNSIKELLKPKPIIRIQVTEECQSDELFCAEWCNNKVAPTDSLYLLRKVRYKIQVVHNDCASTFSIHIKDALGRWLPQTLGDVTYIGPRMSGEYFSIGVRQDNMGFSKANEFGTKSYPDTAVYLPKNCCTLISFDECPKFFYKINTQCYRKETAYSVHKFQVSPRDTSSNSLTSNHSILNITSQQPNKFIFDSLVYESNSVRGLLKVMNQDTEENTLDVSIDYLADNILNTQSFQFKTKLCLLDDRTKSNDKNKDFVIIPNPNSGLFEVTFNSDYLNEQVDISIYNIFGQRVLFQPISSIDNSLKIFIDASILASGNYFLSISSRQGFVAKKFIKE